MFDINTNNNLTSIFNAVYSKTLLESNIDKVLSIFETTKFFNNDDKYNKLLNFVIDKKGEIINNYFLDLIDKEFREKYNLYYNIKDFFNSVTSQIFKLSFKQNALQGIINLLSSSKANEIYGIIGYKIQEDKTKKYITITNPFELIRLDENTKKDLNNYEYILFMLPEHYNIKDLDELINENYNYLNNLCLLFNPNNKINSESNIKKDDDITYIGIDLVNKNINNKLIFYSNKLIQELSLNKLSFSKNFKGIFFTSYIAYNSIAPYYGLTGLRFNNNNNSKLQAIPIKLIPFFHPNISIFSMSICTGSNSNFSLDGLNALKGCNIHSPYQLDVISTNNDLVSAYIKANIKLATNILKNINIEVNNASNSN